MGAHQPLPHLLLLLLLLVSVLVTKRASSSTTLSCFSVGLLDLPTFGFNQEEGKAEEKSEAEGEGRQVTSSFDACFWGLLSFVVFSVVPAGLKSEVARVQERIHAALPSPLAGPPAPDFPDYPQLIDDGNRRLDLNVYNYVDTSGPSNDLADSPFSPGEPPFSLGESPPPFSPQSNPAFPSNSVYEFIHQSSYGVGQAPSYSPSAYQQPSFGIQQPVLVQPSKGEAGESSWPERGGGSPIYSPPISSSLLQDDWEGKLMVGNSGGELASPIEQDYDDIDYTSGGLVTFHTSLSK